MVLDYTLFKPGNALADDLFWVVEQIPGLVQSGDLTWRLRQHGYFGSYNVPQVCEPTPSALVAQPHSRSAPFCGRDMRWCRVGVHRVPGSLPRWHS